MTDSDFWGVVVPTWLGGLGGIAGAVVSTVALITSLRAKGGVETLKSAANATSIERSHSAEATDASARTQGSSVDGPVSWTAWQEAKSRWRLRNDSTVTGASATLTAFEDVTPGGDQAASYLGPLPVQLAAGESVPFQIDKSFVSPSVTAIKLTWEDSDGAERQRTIYL